MGRWILIALCLAWASESLAQSGSDAQDEGYQSLEVLLAAAERNSSGVRAAQYNIAAAEALLSETKGSPFFQFTARAALGVAPDSRGTPIYSPESNQLGLGSGGWNVVSGADVTGAIPLYTWGKLKEARNAAKAGVDAAEGGRDKQIAELRYDVRRAYFGLQFALDGLQLISEGKGKLSSALDRLREQLEDGEPSAREEDVWRLSSTLAEIEANEAEARRLERSSRAALAILTGIDDVHLAECPSEAVTYALKDLSFYSDAARLNRPEGRMLDSAVRARQSAAKAASARYFPDLALVLGVGRTWAPGRRDQLNPAAYDNANRGRLEAGVAARWSLDLWGTHFRSERADAELSATEALRNHANDGITIEVTAAYEKVLAMRDSEVAWARGRADTRAWFLAASQAYQIGANEPKDVVDAVRAYFKVRAAHLNAIREHNTGLAELERTTGTALMTQPDAWEPSCE